MAKKLKIDYRKIISKKKQLQRNGYLVQWYPKPPANATGEIYNFGIPGCLVAWKIS